MDNLSSFNNEKFIEFLNDLSKSRIPWIQRKEISAWSALLFLFVILGTITSFILNTDSKILVDLSKDKSFFCIILTFICAIFYIFFRFIHAQYASIYYMTAYTNIIRELIFTLCEKENTLFENNKISNFESFQKYCDSKVKYDLKNNSKKFQGRCHPYKIVLYLWLPFIYKWFNKQNEKFNRNEKLNVLGNYEKAEASIYSLLIISFLFYIYLVIFLKYFTE